jgi:L-glyceraldehyde 3-phosphate reductase
MGDSEDVESESLLEQPTRVTPASANAAESASALRMWSLSLWVSKVPTVSMDNRGVSVGVGDERITSMPPFDVYSPDPHRYDGRMPYRRTGHSGLKLPAISLGFWHNFGDDKPIEKQRAIMRRAFDLGITHFDLANNYGPPYGSAEINAGRVLREDFSELRDELVISSKAGWDMWPGPYGDLGSRKYILASLDQSLQRLGLDYVDIFYHHRPDPETPLAESMGALATAVQQGKALYVGISSYSPARTLEAARILADLGVPLLIHQPSYSMLNRWIEEGLLDALAEVGAGAITFSPLAQGMLTDRYVDGIPEGSRATEGKSLNPDSLVTGETLDRIKGLAAIAKERGQSLAQMAIAWTLRDPRVTTSLVGASSAAQLEESAGAVKNLDFSAAEVEAIDALAVDTPSIDLWRSQSRFG